MPTAGDRLSARYERDEVPGDAYAAAAAKIAAFQCGAELIGVLPFAEWIDRAPDYARQQMLIAKVQDEVGHGHVMARVAEDLGTTRDSILDDYIEGRSSVLNIFHYGFESWEELGPGALLMNSAAIVQFQSLKHGTYLPYARGLEKIEKEESFHYHHALDLTHELLSAGGEQRQAVVAGFETWFPRVLAYFGPGDSDSFSANPMFQMGLKVDSNDDIRQRWLSKVIPALKAVGMPVDPGLVRFDAEADRWVHIDVAWDNVKSMLANGGPRLDDWLTKLTRWRTTNALYRDVARNAVVAA